MKKILSLILVAGSAASLTACGGVPECVGELDECNRGGAYTEERTVPLGTSRVVERAPAPEPVRVVEPAPVKVAPKPAPAPAPAPVVDTQVMTSAEPEFRQITK